MRIQEKTVAKNGVHVHTILSPVVVKKIAKIAKDNDTKKCIVINEILKKALK